MNAIDDGPLVKIREVLATQGVLAVLRILNSRAPHRFTGIYRYTPELLKNVYLVDAFAPQLQKGDDVALEDAYCMLLRDRRNVSFGDLEGAPCAAKLASPVVSYCGVLLVTSSGEPYGSLCHFDMHRCQKPATEMPLLEIVAPLIMEALEKTPPT
ncbi:MAG: hypothetical protein JWP01_1926 [Myxococcales bacterium]|nr:hypothetical protein [Myxococcales bacterium]